MGNYNWKKNSNTFKNTNAPAIDDEYPENKTNVLQHTKNYDMLSTKEKNETRELIAGLSAGMGGDNTTQDTTFQDAGTVGGGIAGSYYGPVGSMAGAAAGNLVGKGIDYMTSEKQADNQLERQKELQNQANQMNEENVRRQAVAQVTGMQQAGMNPANTTFTGAPTVQSGSAAMGNAGTMGNIFDGLAQVIQAIKAPTEIEHASAQIAKEQAETSKTRKETDIILPKQAENIEKATGKLAAETKNEQNLNLQFEQMNEFVTDTAKGVFDSYRAQLKATGQWEELPLKTRITIEELADGNLEMNAGALEGLNRVIASTGNISATDKQIIENTKNMIIDIQQMKDKKIMDAFKNLPEKQYRKISKEISLITKQISLVETEDQAKAIEARIRNLENPYLMLDLGQEKELKNYVKIEAAKETADLLKGILNAKVNAKKQKKGSRTTTKGPKGKTTTTTEYF